MENTSPISPSPTRLKPELPSDEAITQTSSPLNFFRQVTLDASSKACVSGAVGYALRVVGSGFAWTFFGHASGVLATRLVINVTKEYNLPLTKSLDTLSEQALDFFNSYPLLRLIGFLFAVVVSTVSIELGFVLGLATGAATALTMDLEQSGKRLLVKEAEERGAGIGDIINQWV